MSKSEPPSGISLAGVLLVPDEVAGASSSGSGSVLGLDIGVGSIVGAVDVLVRSRLLHVVVLADVEERATTGVGSRLESSGSSDVATAAPALSAGSSSGSFGGASDSSSSSPRSNRELPPLAFAAGPTSSVSVTVSSVWVLSPASGSALVSSDSVDSSRSIVAVDVPPPPSEVEPEAAAALVAAPLGLPFDSPLTAASSSWATSRTSISSRASPLLWR